jgi:hypothetical protein
VILEKLGREEDAISELEAVLQRHSNPAWVHQQLARLYGKLGEQELAAMHARLAEQISTQPDQ